MEQKKPIETIVRSRVKVITLVLVIPCLLLVVYGVIEPTEQKPLPKEAFLQAVTVETKTATIGANVTLSQTIHGSSDRVTYRYKLKTDCPFWQYEDRYETNHPLAWAKGKTAAVETKATSVDIQLDKKTLLTGQYFEVPLLRLQQDDVPYEDFEASLKNTAYQQYELDINTAIKQEKLQRIVCLIGGVLLGGLLYIVWTNRTKPTKSDTMTHVEEQIGYNKEDPSQPKHDNQ